MIPFARLTISAFTLAGVAGCGPFLARPCLEGHEGQGQSVRDEWRKANDRRVSWKERICATEGLMSYANASTQDDAPACIEEVLDHYSAALGEASPTRYDRQKLAQLRAVAATSQTTDHFASKAAAVIEAAAIEEHDLRPYNLTPGESGPPLDRAVFRRIALHALANPHLAMNRPEVLEAALTRRRGSVDAIDRWILQGVTTHQLTKKLSGDIPKPLDRDNPALFDQILGETEAALDRPFAPVEHGLLLSNLRLLSFLAPNMGRAPAVARLRRRILDGEARLLSVKGQPAARRDLFVSAAIAEVAGEAGGAFTEPPFEAWYELPPPDLEATLFAPPLYERGFDCRGKDATALFLPRLLTAFDAGTLGAEPPDPSPRKPSPITSVTLGAFTLDDLNTPTPFEKLIGYLPARPGVLDTRPALRALVLAQPESLLLRSRTSWHRDDPLIPLQRALFAAPSTDPAAIAVVHGMLAAVRQRYPSWRNARDLMLAARVAPRFGLEGEVRALADELGKPPKHPIDPKSPVFGVIAATGLRASLTASAFPPW